MKIRSKFAQLLVPLFVVALLAGSASPALGIADDTNFKDCSDGTADAANCVVLFKVGSATEDVDNGGIDLKVFFASDMLQIQVSDGDQDLGAGHLDTVFSMTIEVTNNVDGAWDPILVIGSGEISTWTWNAGTNELSITATPEAVSFATPNDTNQRCNQTGSAEKDFEQGGECATADMDFAAMLGMAAADVTTTAELNAQNVPAQFHDEVAAFEAAYKGGWIATDAQEFGVPQMDPETENIKFSLSAPHFTSNGTTVNTGFFHVLIPEPVWTDLWDATFDQNTPPTIGATADGSAVSLQTPVFVAARVAGGTTLPAGWLIKSNTITYSSPEIKLSPSLASSVAEDEPTEFDPSRGGTGPATTRLPVALPDTGELTRDVTLTGTGASLLMPQGTTVTVGGVPFTGTIDPPQRVQGRPSGLRSAVSITATGSADVQSVSALANEDIVFDPPVTITIVDTSEEAAASRVVRIAPDGSITDMAGTMTGRGVTAQITGLGTYGLATELDLAEITTAPSISVGLPVRLPADGIIDFPTTVKNDSAALGFAAGTAVTDSTGAAFTGTLTAPTSATAPSGVGSTVDLGNVATGAQFSQPATLSVFAPAGVAAGDSALVSVSGIATTCLTSTLAADTNSLQVRLTTPSGVFGLALPVVADPQVAIRELFTAAGLHSQWAGQSATPSLCAGQVAELAVRLRNTGTEAWTVGGKQALLALNPGLGTGAIDAGLVSPLYDTRLATHEADVLPGDVATFRLKVRAPATAGTHIIHIRPVVEGHTWLEDEGIHLLLTVR